MTIQEAKDSLEQPCNVQLGDKVFNGVVRTIHEDSEEVTVAFPDGRNSLPTCCMAVYLGHATENVATEADFEEAKRAGEELEKQYPNSNKNG